MKIYDLTWPVLEESIVPEYLSPATLTPIWHHSIQGISIQLLCTATHLGTHMDAPYHFIKDGATIDQIPLQRCIGQGIVIDIPCQEPRAITQPEIAAAAEKAGGVRAGDLVLIRTSWDVRYGTSDYLTWPFLDLGAVDWLVECGMALFGADTQGVERPLALREAGEFAFPIHHRLLGMGIPIVEGLAHLSLVAGRRVMVAVVPLLLVGGDGSPVRAIAWDQ